MAELRLHLDADASRKDLLAALLARGHDVTRTPAPGLTLDASDLIQLLWAAAQYRVLFTFNIKDFLHLARKFPDHHGILLANQRSHTLGELILLLDRVLTDSQAEDFTGRVRWLTDWR